MLKGIVSKLTGYIKRLRRVNRRKVLIFSCLLVVFFFVFFVAVYLKDRRPKEVVVEEVKPPPTCTQILLESYRLSEAGKDGAIQAKNLLENNKSVCVSDNKAPSSEEKQKIFRYEVALARTRLNGGDTSRKMYKIGYDLNQRYYKFKPNERNLFPDRTEIQNTLLDIYIAGAAR